MEGCTHFRRCTSSMLVHLNMQILFYMYWVMFCLSGQLSVDDLAAVQRKLYDVNTKWYNLGLELGLRPPTLDSIDAKYNSDPSQCFRQVLKEWLNGVNPPPTWQAMVNALKSPTVSQYKLAEQIQTELPTPLSTQPLAPQPLSPQSLSPQHQSPRSPSTSSQLHPKSSGLYIYMGSQLCIWEQSLAIVLRFF